MKRIDTILIMMMLVVSTAAGVVFVGAQTPEPQVHVKWNEAHSFEEFEHTEQNDMWIFGPQPITRAYYHVNDTDISENHYLVSVETELDINITIPSAFLGREVGLESVLFWGRGEVDRSPLFAVKYNLTADRWESLAFIYIPGSEEPVTSSFITLDTSKSSYQVLPDGHLVSFHIKYQSSVGPRILWTGLQIINTNERAVSPSWLAALSSGGFETPPLGLEVPVKRADFGLPDYYYAKVTDTDGAIIHYVGFDDVFVFHLTANVPLGEVLIPFSLFTMDKAFYYNYTFSIPKDPYQCLTNWTTVNGVPPMLLLRYNNGSCSVAAGYLDNVQWEWDNQLGVWYPTFSFLLNSSIDLSKYYVLVDTQVLNGGATLSWTGYYTNMTDMNPDNLTVGATIVPDPFFWSVVDQGGEALLARPEIKTHNTVKLAFMEHFIDATVTHNGNIVHRVQQGETLNITLNIFGPGSLINGSTYIPTNISIPHGNDIVDLTGLLLHVRRDNISLYVESRGFGRNTTHYWSKTLTFAIVLYYPSQTFAWTVSNTTIYYDTYTHEEVFRTVDSHNDWLTVYKAGLEIGSENSTAWFDISFGSQVPDMYVSAVHLYSGFRLLGQWNASVRGSGTWFWYPPTSELNWTTAYSENSSLDDVTLWTPTLFIIGDIDPWEPERWTVTRDGALDLDGNVFTTDDQYYVIRTGYWHDWGNITTDGMMVFVGLDPTPGIPGDEFVSHNWMGIVKMMVEFSANETFYWYRASDLTPVNTTEIDRLRDMMWSDAEHTIPNPGYRYIAWMTVNRTIDIGGMIGLPDNEWHNTWLAWGTQQMFTVSNSATSTTWAVFRAKYAGLFLFNDTLAGGAESAPDFAIVDGRVVTEEVTHLVLIDSVESIELRIVVVM